MTDCEPVMIDCNASIVTSLFQNNVMFLLKIILIYDEPLSSHQPL